MTFCRIPFNPSFKGIRPPRIEGDFIPGSIGGGTKKLRRDCSKHGIRFESTEVWVGGIADRRRGFQKKFSSAKKGFIKDPRWNRCRSDYCWGWYNRYWWSWGWRWRGSNLFGSHGNRFATG